MIEFYGRYKIVNIFAGHKDSPIEMWLQMAEDLLNNGTDFSKVLSQVNQENELSGKTVKSSLSVSGIQVYSQVINTIYSESYMFYE